MRETVRNILGTIRHQPPPRLWPVVTAALLIGLAAVNYYVAVTLKHAIIAREEAVLSRIADATASTVENILNVTVLALENIDNTVAKGAMDGEGIHRTLGIVTQSVPFLRMTGIFDTKGDLVYSSISYPPAKLNLAKRDFMAYYLNGGSDRYFVSGPSINSTDKKWQIVVSRAMREHSGALRGIQVAVIDNHYLYSELLFSEHDVHRGGKNMGHHHYFVTLVDREFRLVARSPWDEKQIGTSLAGSELYRSLVASGMRDAAGLFTGFFDGDQRVGAAQWLAGRRFILSISCELGMVLEYWRTTVGVTGVGSVALLAMFGFTWWRTARERREQLRHSHDLTQVNLALEQQTARAEESARAKSAFLANMSHEIRTPINSILGYSGLALEDKTMSAESQRFIRQVFNASNNLRVIIDDILDLSKIEAGAVSLVAIPFAIAGLADNCRSIIDPLAKAKGLEVRFRIDPSVPAWLAGDEVRIQQVLLNLAYNAIKFTETGSVEIAIACRQIVDGRATIEFTVRDTGIGIAPDKLDMLFQRFEQADGSITRRYGGTGLGLAICKALVSSMGGSIGVESKLGSGSTFRFALTLPVAAESAMVAARDGKAGPRLRILVVDDFEANCELVKTLLERAGHRVDTVNDGGAAVNACARRSYDLVLMDVRMPGMDGLEATRQIRLQGEEGRKLRIVAMTANVMPDQVALYRQAGMNDFLGKPIDRGQLFALIERWTAPASPPGETVAEHSVHDPAMLDAVRDALGVERTRSFLVSLQSGLARSIWQEETLDNDELMGAAHSAVGLAGQLGFCELSAAARRLEEAILDGKDVAAALTALHAARERAAPVLAELIAVRRPQAAAVVGA